MISRNDALECLRSQKALLKRYGVTRIAVFGSVARNEATPESDVDVLVEFDDQPGLFEFMELQEALQACLGRRVDLATPAMLHPSMRDQIMMDAVDV